MTKQKKTSLEKRFDCLFERMSKADISLNRPGFYRALRQELKRERIEVLNEAVELSDRIEMGRESTLEEWKAFKHFRNTLRDKYLKENA